MPTRNTQAPANLLEAARRIWFAGLGVLVIAQDEGRRLMGGTSTLFVTLVERGEELTKAGILPADRVKETAASAERALTEVRSAVDRRVIGALQRLGVPTRDEMAELTRQIEQLTASIEALKAQA